jgi:hypothetical protein
MAEWIFDFFNNAHFESPINEAKEEGSYEVVWTDRDYKKNSKVFKNDPKGAPDNAKKKAEAFKKALEDKDKKSKDGLYRSIDLNEASKEEETKFHKKLDKLVHSTFGKRKDELEEAVNLKSSKLSSAEYQKAKKLKDFKASDWKWNASEDLYTKVNEGIERKIFEALDKINEELCPAGKAYRKRRIAAGEKSSAYLSGRAVKVCKGQMSGKKKKK